MIKRIPKKTFSYALHPGDNFVSLLSCQQKLEELNEITIRNLVKLPGHLESSHLHAIGKVEKKFIGFLCQATEGVKEWVKNKFEAEFNPEFCSDLRYTNHFGMGCMEFEFFYTDGVKATTVCIKLLQRDGLNNFTREK